MSEIHKMNLETLNDVANSDHIDLVLRAFQMEPDKPEDFDVYNMKIGFHYPTIIDPAMVTHYKSNMSHLILVFFLDLDRRYELLKKTQIKLQQDNEYSPDYYAITLVQSFCAILIMDINAIKYEVISDFLSGFSLGWACLPLYHELCGEIFMSFYSKFLTQCPQSLIFEHLIEIDKIGVEFSQFFPSFTSVLFDSINLLFSYIIDTDNPQKTQSNFDSHTSLLLQHLIFVLKAVNWRLAELSTNFTILFENIVQIIPFIKVHQIPLIYRLFSFIFHYFQPPRKENQSTDEVTDSQGNSFSYPQTDTNLRQTQAENRIFPAIANLFDRFISDNQKENNLFANIPNQSKQDDITDRISELKYFEIPSKEPLPIDSDEKLSNYEFDSKKFVEIFDNETSIIKKIVDIFINLTGLYSLQRPIFEFLFSICRPKIESGDLKYQAIIQIYLHYETINLEKLCSYIGTKHILDTLLLNRFLFDSSISLFDYKNNKSPDIRILMRFHLFNMIQKLFNAKPQTEEIINSLVIFLNSIMINSHLFSEVLYLINYYKIMALIPVENIQSKENIVELIANEISIQQQVHALGDQRARIYRPIFLLLIGSFALNEKINDMMCQNQVFVKSVLSLLFEPGIHENLSVLICQLSTDYIQQAETQLFNYFKPSLQMVMKSLMAHFNSIQDDLLKTQTSDNDKLIQTLEIFTHFILVLQFFINDGTNKFISFFVDFQLFEEFCSLIPALPPVHSEKSNPDLIAPYENLIIALIDFFELLDNSPLINKKSIPFNILIQPIRNFKITPKIYERLKFFVSSGKSQFKSIENSEALPLLVFSVEGTDYFPQVLKEIANLCRDSLWNCFTVFDSGILFELLEKVDQNKTMVLVSSDNNEYDLEIILSLFCCVNIYVSSRQLVYAFERLFHIFDEMTTQTNETENSIPISFTKTVTPKIEFYLNFFRNMFSLRSSVPSSFIHFASIKESILMQSPPLKDLNLGFTISIWMLLDKFDESNEAFSITLFKGKTSTLHFYLLKNKLCIEFNSKDQSFRLDTNLTFPVLKWFNLTMNYDKDNGLTAYINGSKGGYINQPLNFLIEDFQTMEFHGESTRSLNWILHAQLSLFALFTGGYNINTSAQLANTIYTCGFGNSLTVSSMPFAYYVYSPFKARDDILINHKEEIASNAKFVGTIYTFVACFCQIFESSNGAAFLTSLWSLIGLTYPDGKAEKELISWLTQILETVCQMSQITQEQLTQINAFQTIAFFLGNLPDNRLSIDVWNCFNRLFKNVDNSKLKRDLCHHILFNFAIWQKASLDSASSIFEEWRFFFQTVPYDDWKDLTIKHMIDILYFYLRKHMKYDNIQMVIHIICICMCEMALQSFSQDDAESALQFCQIANEQSTVLSLLKVFENVFYNKTDIDPTIFLNTLLAYIPPIFTTGNMHTKDEIILLFTIIYENTNYDISILFNFVYSVVCKKQLGSQNAFYIMKYFMVKSIDSNVSDFEKTTSYIITSTPYFFISLFAAIFVSDNDRVSQFLPFIGKVSAFPDNQIKISNDLNDYMILLLVFFGIVVDSSSLPFLSAFLYRNYNHLSLAFLMIDALERYIECDFTNHSDDLIIQCSSFLVSNSAIPNRDKYFELLLAKLLHHRTIGEYSWDNRNPVKNVTQKEIEPETQSQFRIRNQQTQKGTDDSNKIKFSQYVEQAMNLNDKELSDQIKSPKYFFGCLLQNENLIEFKAAKSVLQLLLILIKDPKTLLNPILVSSFIFCLTLQKVDINPLLPLLSQIIEIMKNSFIPEPFLFNISQRKVENQPKAFLMKYFNQDHIERNITLFQKAKDVLDECSSIIHHLIEQSVSSLSITQSVDSLSNLQLSQNSSASHSHSVFGSTSLNTQLSPNISSSFLNLSLPDNCFNNNVLIFVHNFFNKLATSIAIPEPIQPRYSLILPTFPNSDQSWRRLLYKLRNERSPLISDLIKNKDRHYKRPSYYDFRFRPILLVPNNRFDLHLKASELAMQQSSKAETSNIDSQTDLFSKSSKSNEIPDEEFGSDEKLIWSSQCEKINMSGRKSGTFSVFSSGYRFTCKKSIVLKAESVLYIYWRWDLLKPNSIEIFMDDHKSYFFSFIGQTNHSFVTNKLLKIQLPNKRFIQTKAPQIEVQNLHLTEQWLNYSISTFDYIMQLNMLSGRSFLNPSCYPVFPWILVDYSSLEFNVNNKTIYRDFKMPIGAFNTQALNRTKEKMQAEIEAAQAEYEAGSIDVEQYNELSKRSSFLYQTGYSNPFIVTYYLLRLEPFTTLHISLMDGRFDNPNRLFMSIPESFKMLITTSSTFRELTPEFFFQPEFLLNSDKFNFGETLNKGVVNNVELPNWSKTPQDFIYKHIKALESDYCSHEISNWIDLIFGYKQNGQNAIDSDNTFDPHMYENTVLDESDPRTNHIRELIGQIPIQLFDSEHPKRGIRSPTQNISPNTTYRSTIAIGGSNSSLVTALNYEGDSPENMKIYSVHKNGKIYVTRLKEYKAGPALLLTAGSNGPGSTCLYSGSLIPTDPRFIATFGHSTFVCALNDGSGILATQSSMLKSGKAVVSQDKPHIAAISCISVYSNYIITGACDTSVVLWKNNKSNISVIAQSVVNNDTITAVCVNNNYGIAISCSRDGIMTIFRIPHLDFIRSINFNPDNSQSDKSNKLTSTKSATTSFSASSVLVTNGMGNIIVVLKNENLDGSMKSEKSTMIRSYTINGQWITSTRLECEVIDAVPITSKTREDYMLILIEQPMAQELLLFDAQTLDIVGSIHKVVLEQDLSAKVGTTVSTPKITKFAYHEEAGFIVLAFSNLELLVIPFNL